MASRICHVKGFTHSKVSALPLLRRRWLNPRASQAGARCPAAGGWVCPTALHRTLGKTPGFLPRGLMPLFQGLVLAQSLLLALGPAKLSNLAALPAPDTAAGSGFCIYYFTVTSAGKDPFLRQVRCIF